MTAKCIHKLDPYTCEICKAAIEEEPLPSDALQHTISGQAVLVLRRKPGSKRAEVLRLDDEGPVVTLDLIRLRAGPPSGVRRNEIIRRFHQFALRKGFLFHPQSALPYRELAGTGLSHCYYCRKKLSFQKGSLGCSQCRRYVCDCGRCLCGTAGKNWQGTFFGPLPELPIARTLRLEFVRVVKYCYLQVSS